jgi:hypothetical protein
LLEAYLRGCGSHRGELKKQIDVLTQLLRVASLVKVNKKQESNYSVAYFDSIFSLVIIFLCFVLIFVG